VSETPRVVFRPSGITPDLARYARACAWAYVFECFNRRNGTQGSRNRSRTTGKDKR
jgi:hypothetical protein